MELEAQRRRSSSASSSPEFEFWMVRNPFLSQDLLTADELIVDGVLLPLHHLSLQHPYPTDPPPSPPIQPPPDLPPASILSSSSTSNSRRWKDLFKAVGDPKPEEKEKKKGSSNGHTEVNINLNIWPFSLSRSAGNIAGRPRSASRKISSAPCSRSNSRDESPAGWKWAASPGRSRIHLSRSSPVWQVRRTGMGSKKKDRKSSPDPSTSVPVSAGGGMRVLNLNVNSCIGNRNQVSCRDDDSDGLTTGARTTEGNGSKRTIFSPRALFTRKVYTD